MEVSMKLVETHCSKYLDMFGQCMKKFPHTWHLDCELERKKLAKCAETNPEIAYIKTSCAKEFFRYESCMLNNQDNSDMCTELFSSFSACADTALTSYSSKDKKVEPLNTEAKVGATAAEAAAAGVEAAAAKGKE